MYLLLISLTHQFFLHDLEKKFKFSKSYLHLVSEMTVLYHIIYLNVSVVAVHVLRYKRMYVRTYYSLSQDIYSVPLDDF